MKNDCDILIIDDNDEMIELLLVYFSIKKKKAYGLTWSNDYIKDICDYNPHVILLDVIMPRINGFQLCTKIKESEQTRGIKVFLITALPRTDVRPAVEKAGADGYILKPFSLSDLDFVIEYCNNCGQEK
nr:response regulator [Candidatus Sigynarchaeota archaeon]